MKRRNNKELLTSIKRTLIYRAIFNYPMSFFQIGTYLISRQQVKENELRRALNTLIKKGWLKKRYGKYEICGEKYSNWDLKRKSAVKLINDNYPILKFLGGIPWVTMIAVTGSVSAYNPDKKPDLDLLIVTKKNRVWITRGFVALILKIIKKQPEFDGQPGSFCTNIFMDESKLSWEKERRNIFVANDIAMMQPIVNKGQAYLRFFKENKWVFDYFSNFQIDLNFKDKPDKSGTAFSTLNKLAKKLQLNYMKKKVTTEVLRANLIHFNKNDNTTRIIRSFSELKKKHGITG